MLVTHTTGEANCSHNTAISSSRWQAQHAAESKGNVTGLTCDKGQPLNAIKVGVLNSHDAGISKDLLREVVDELTVNKAVEALTDNVLHLDAHLLLLCLLYVCHLPEPYMTC